MKLITAFTTLSATAYSQNWKNGYWTVDGEYFREDAYAIATYMGMNQILGHGCWCSRMTGTKVITGGNTVDEIDEKCKEWMMKRRCLNIDGGHCSDPDAERAYQLERNYIWGNSSAQLCRYNSNCGRSMCYVDNQAFLELQELFDAETFQVQIMREGQCGEVSTNVMENPRCWGAVPDFSILDIPSVPLPEASFGDISRFQQSGGSVIRSHVYQMKRVDEMYFFITETGVSVRSPSSPYAEITDHRASSVVSQISETWNRVYTIDYDPESRMLIITGSSNVYVFWRSPNTRFYLKHKFAVKAQEGRTRTTDVLISSIRIDGDRVYMNVDSVNEEGNWISNVEIYKKLGSESKPYLSHFKTTEGVLDRDRYIGMDLNEAYLVGYNSNEGMIKMYSKDGDLVKEFASRTTPIWGIKIIGDFIITGTQNGHHTRPEVNLYDTLGNKLQTVTMDYGYNIASGGLTTDGNIIFVTQEYYPQAQVLKLEYGALIPFGPDNGIANLRASPKYQLLIDTQEERTKILAANSGGAFFSVYDIIEE